MKLRDPATPVMVPVLNPPERGAAILLIAITASKQAPKSKEATDCSVASTETMKHLTYFEEICIAASSAILRRRST